MTGLILFQSLITIILRSIIVTIIFSSHYNLLIQESPPQKHSFEHEIFLIQCSRIPQADIITTSGLFVSREKTLLTLSKPRTRSPKRPQLAYNYLPELWFDSVTEPCRKVPAGIETKEAKRFCNNFQLYVDKLYILPTLNS